MFFALAILSIASANAIDVPMNVLTAFQAKYPAAHNIEWSEEEEEEFYTYTAAFLLDGRAVESMFSEDGEWVTSITTLTEEDLLPEITAYLKSNYEEASVLSAKKIEDEDGEVYTISIEVVIDEEEDETEMYVLSFDSDGQLIED